MKRVVFCNRLSVFCPRYTYVYHTKDKFKERKKEDFFELCVFCVCVYLYLFYIYFFFSIPHFIKNKCHWKKILLIYYIKFLLVACTIYLFISIFFENIWTKIEILSFCWQDMYLSCIMWSKISVVLKLYFTAVLLSEYKILFVQKHCGKNTSFHFEKRIERIVQSKNFYENSIKRENISLKKIKV